MNSENFYGQQLFQLGLLLLPVNIRVAVTELGNIVRGDFIGNAYLQSNGNRLRYILDHHCRLEGLLTRRANRKDPVVFEQASG